MKKALPAALPLAGKREQNKQANRALILEAARKCFLKQGYDAVTVRDIVRRTRLASGTFYNYFRSKDELFRSVLETRIQEISSAMHEVRARAATVEDFIYGAYRTLFVKIAEDPAFFHLILRNEHAVRSLFQDTVVGIPMRALKTDIEQAIARGVFPAIDVDLLAAAFFGAGFEMGRSLAQAKQPDAEASARFATQLLTSGVRGFGLAQSASARRRPRTLP